MISRRAFLKYTGAGVLTLYVTNAVGITEAVAAIPGGTLDPKKVKKYVTPLLVPPAMPMAGDPDPEALVDHYEISVSQFPQQILPAGLPATIVWGYGAVEQMNHNAPSYTIEARTGRPVRVTWVNDLKQGDSYLPHLLPVDPTLHWANPPGGIDGRDSHQDFTGKTYVPLSEFDPEDETQYTTYQGPVPMVVHLHGAVGVGDESDGYTEAWLLPDAEDIPEDYATTGTWHDFFAEKAADEFDVTWGPGYATVQYPNEQPPSTLWFHDHTLGMTRLNVYAGPAGFFLLRDTEGGDGDITVSGTGEPAVLPGPAPQLGDAPGTTYYEIPLAIQDRSFNSDGSLFYPDTRAFFDGVTGPYVPDSEVSPVFNPEFFGNMMMVNGRTWPFHEVEQRRYRLRLLNGCNSRTLIVDFAPITGVSVWQIGTEAGLLPVPVDITTTVKNEVLLGPAERADLIVDFTDVPVGSYQLRNVGPDAPFGGGKFKKADPSTTGRIMQFRVVPATSADPTTPPADLVLPAPGPLGDEVALTRKLALIEKMDEELGVPYKAQLGTVDEGGQTQAIAWMDEVAVTPAVGTTEIWEIYNATVDAHPIHVHEVTFEVVDRQAITVTPGAGDPIVEVVSGSVPVPPPPTEAGRKETILAYPGQVTRIRMHFANEGQFVWHCHIVEHEDHEMMLPMRIGLDPTYGPSPTMDEGED